MSDKLISGILEVCLFDTLLELHFNVTVSGRKQSLSLMILDDGETIQVDQNGYWKTPENTQYEAFSTKWVTDDRQPLGQLIDTNIEAMKCGIGKSLNGQAVAYYFHMTTNNTFLFFNNGDQGGYLFEGIDAFLKEDIYGFTWKPVKLHNW